MHRILHGSAACLLLLLCAACLPAYSQVGTYPSGSGSSGRNEPVPSPSRVPSDYLPDFDPNLSHRQVFSRREELKKRMGENAARLLTLTHDLQTDLQGREPNAGDAKRLDEIAKLARTVRDEMRQ